MRITLLMLLIAVVSCNKTTSNKSVRMNLLANRTCRAISIRQERFALANKIRFAQDTLSHTKNQADSIRLQARLKIYLAEKPVLLKESLNLADTIHKQLDSLIPYTDKAAEKRFNAELDSLLKKKGCMDTAGHSFAN